ncbi:MAG: PKD domain-containing protein, partial [Flavobacteriales bacterium]
VEYNSSAEASFDHNAPQCFDSHSIDFFNTGSSGAGWSHSWDFGSGASPASSTSENPSGIIYSSSGTKFVTHKVSDGAGCKDSLTKSIEIFPNPVADA